MRKIALIPARGGSQGLPGKNIKLLKGKPLIVHTIEAALQSNVFDEVIVSTDVEEIADIAKSEGASVPFLRPAHLASSESNASDTYLFTLEKLESNGDEVESIAILQPTSPLRNSTDIKMAYNLFQEKEADSVVSYTIESHPIFWHKFILENATFEEVFPNYPIQNRQKSRPTYYPNGAIFIFRREMILAKNYYSSKSFAYIMPKSRSIDIDDLDDFKYAEFLISNP